MKYRGTERAQPWLCGFERDEAKHSQRQHERVQLDKLKDYFNSGYEGHYQRERAEPNQDYLQHKSRRCLHQISETTKASCFPPEVKST